MKTKSEEVTQAQINRMTDKEYDRFMELLQAQEWQKIITALAAVIALAPDVQAAIARDWLQKNNLRSIDAGEYAEWKAHLDARLLGQMRNYAEYPWMAKRDGVSMSLVNDYLRAEAKRDAEKEAAHGSTPKSGRRTDKPKSSRSARSSKT